MGNDSPKGTSPEISFEKEKKKTEKTKEPDAVPPGVKFMDSEVYTSY